MDAVATPSETSGGWLARFVIGVFLLLPGLLLYSAVQLKPVLDTVAYSRTDFNALSESEFVGMANYNRLAEDQIFSEGVRFTLNILLVRLVIVALIPPLVGMLVGAQGRLGRMVNQVLLAVIGVLISPVALAILASSFLSPFWGNQPSPFEARILASVETAPLAIMTVDAMITLALAAVVGGSAFIAVMRGRRERVSIARALVGVWLLGLLFTLLTAPQTFILPFIMTRGGPANATMTMSLAFYQNAFAFFSLGYASAQAVLWVAIAEIAALLIWAVLVFFRLHLVVTPPLKAAQNTNSLAVVSVPLVLLIGLPTIGLALWGFAQAGLSSSPELNVGQAFANTVTIPWTAIWLVQIPLTYMIGLSLGFVRPISKFFF